MSILKDLRLKGKDREEKLADFNFLFKKKQGTGVRKNRRNDLVIIGKATISIRPEVAAKFEIKDGCYGALAMDENQVKLIIRDQSDPNLYAIQGGKKRYSLHINIPKASREFVVNFEGKYETGESKTVEGKYLVIDLVRIKED